MTPLDAAEGSIGGRGCRLAAAAGRVLPCEDTCAFWEAGGAVVGPGCLLDRVPLDLRREPESARSLAELKERLEAAVSAREQREAHTELAALVEHGLQGGARG